MSVVLFKIVLLSTQIMIGAVTTLINKAQSSYYVYEGPFYKQNFHPFMQVKHILQRYIYKIMKTLAMFIGEFLCLPLFFILRHKNKQSYKQKQVQAIKNGKKLHLNKFILFLPVFCDMMTSTLQFIAINFVPMSAYQLLKGGNIVTTFILSILILKRSIVKHQLAGSLFALIGILIVGIANVIDSDQEQFNGSAITQIFGYGLLIIALFFSACFYVSQQKILSIYYIEPIEMVGFQGLFGLSTYIIVVTVLNYIPCSINVQTCIFTKQGLGYIEVTSVFLNKMIDHWWLLLLTISWIFFIMVYNPLGVTITKHINAVARTIADVSQSILVWIFGIIITLGIGSKYSNYKWEKISSFIIILQLVGFLFLVLGNIIFNQVWEPSFLKPAKEKNQLLFSEQTESESEQKLTQESNKIKDNKKQ